MAVNIIWSPKAEETFDKITDDLLEKWTEKVVVKFVQKTFKCIDQIALFPLSNPALDQRPNIRRCTVNKHISLFYRINNDQIELITFHTNRQYLDDSVFEE